MAPLSCRAAARSNVGAVMGSRVKAVIFEKPAHPLFACFRGREGFALRKDLNKILADGAAEALRRVGTADGVITSRRLAACRCAYSGKSWRDQKDRFRPVYGNNQQPGPERRACQPGCVVRCNLIQDENGSHLTGGLEYETVALCGANCEITDYNVIMRMDRFCDDLGLDTIETGATIASAWRRESSLG